MAVSEGNRLGMQRVQGAPAMGVVGTSLWIAWITIIYSVDASFPTAMDARQTTSDAFIVSTFALSATLVVLSLVPRWTMRRLLGPRPLAAASVVGAAATLVVLNGWAVPSLLFISSAAATGCVTALIALRAGVMFSEVETKAMLASMGSTLMLGVLVYAFDMMLLLCNLRSIAAVVLVLLLPLSAFGLSFDAGDELDAPEADGAGGRAPLPAKLARLVAFVVTLLFLLSLTRGYYPNLIDESQFAAARCIVGLGLVVAGAALVALAWAVPRNAAFGTVFYGLFLVSVLTVLVLSLLNVSPTVVGDVSSVLFGTTLLCLWALLCRVSFRSGRLAVQVVGLGFGAACLGTTAGVGVGSAIYRAGMPTGTLAFVMALAIVLCVAASLFLLRLNDVRALMEPAAGDLANEFDGAAESLDAASAEESATSLSASEGDVADASPLDGYQASLRRLCAVLAVDYGLSMREKDVLEQLVVGKDAKAIADELFISFNTVRSHIRRIYVKLDVHSRQELLELVKEGSRN